MQSLPYDNYKNSHILSWKRSTDSDLRLAFLLNSGRFSYLQKKKKNDKTRGYTISNITEIQTSQLLNPPILTNPNFSHSQTLLAIRNSSRKPKLFSQTEILLAPTGIWTRASLHRSSLLYPLGHWLLSVIWSEKSKFKLLISIRYLVIRVIKLGLMRQIGNICVTMSRGRKLVGIIGVCYKPA